MAGNRYQVESSEGEFQPGSDGLVLRNRLGITTQEDMNELELSLLAQLYEEVLLRDFPERKLTIPDLKRWHHLWLGNVYSWAGQERSVNMAKGDFMFAAAGQIPRLLAQFERQYLEPWTPCGKLATGEVVRAMAITHVEFILIHPFREGNGRLSRLLADVMAIQAGHGPLDYSSWETGQARYIQAIHAGFSGNYAPMEACIREAMRPGKEDVSEPA